MFITTIFYLLIMEFICRCIMSGSCDWPRTQKTSLGRHCCYTMKPRTIMTVNITPPMIRIRRNSDPI